MAEGWDPYYRPRDPGDYYARPERQPLAASPGGGYSPPSQPQQSQPRDPAGGQPPPPYPDIYRPDEPAYQPPGSGGYRPGPDHRAYPPRGVHQPPPQRREPQSFPYIVSGLIFFVIVAAVGGFIAGRNTAPKAAAPTAASTSAPAVPSASAAPATAAAAKAAATTYFSLYAAGQYAATYPLLDPLARRRIPEATWVTVHQHCRSSTSGLSYKVGKATQAGNSAVMSVSLAGVASSLGSEEVTFVYRGGGWLYAPSDLSSYNGTAARIGARLKAAGNCG
jgi:hypothetical protein